MSKLIGRKVKFVAHDLWTREYVPGDRAEIISARMSDEGPAIVVGGTKCTQIVSTKSVRYLNNKPVVLT